MPFWQNALENISWGRIAVEGVLIRCPIVILASVTPEGAFSARKNDRELTGRVAAGPGTAGRLGGRGGPRLLEEIRSRQPFLGVELLRARGVCL